MMGRPRLSDEEKKIREAARKQQKIAKRKEEWESKQREWDRQAEVARKERLATMSEEEQKKFLDCISFAQTISSQQNAFAVDIANKWAKYGNLSEKQILAFIKTVDRIKESEIVSETIQDFFAIGSTVKMKMHIEKAQNTEFFDPMTNSYVIFFNIMLKCEAGIRFKIKTNSKKMIELFSKAFENKKQVEVQATAKYHYEGSDILVLSSKGMKAKVID